MAEKSKCHTKLNDWIAKKDRGYLKRVKENLMPEFRRIEHNFRNRFGDSVKPGKNVINIL